MPSSFEIGGFVPPEAEKKPPAEAAPSAKTESAENREAVEKFIDASLEELCERYLSKFNEGNNGIILKLKMDDIPEKLREDLKANGIELGDEKVAKILKIYSGGKGRKEFEMQKKAHDLVEAQGDKEKFAKVPKPYFYRDFPVGPAAKERLKGMTDKMQGGDRVEMFMMDFVPGDDVATILYKEVAKRHEKTLDIAGHVDEMPFTELQDRVFSAVDARIPGGKARNAAERDFEMRKVYGENAEKIDAFLEKNGFRIDMAVIEQIENTMNLFHKNGLAFRDGHHRNFMITGDHTADPEATAAKTRPQVFIIDYGAATELEGRQLSEVFREVEGDEGKDAVVRNYPDDFAVSRQLRRFAAVPGERMSPEERQYIEEMQRRRKSLERNPRLSQNFAATLDGAKAGKLDIASVYRELVGRQALPSGDAVERFITTAHAIAEEAPGTKEEITRFINELLKGNLPLPSRNKLTRFLGAMK